MTRSDTREFAAAGVEARLTHALNAITYAMHHAAVLGDYRLVSRIDRIRVYTQDAIDDARLVRTEVAS